MLKNNCFFVNNKPQFIDLLLFFFVKKETDKIIIFNIQNNKSFLIDIHT